MKQTLNHGPVEPAYREALAHLEGLAAMATERLPDVTPKIRGNRTDYRLSEPNWDAIFALKLMQLVGNIKAGELLVVHGMYYEWDMVERLVYETLEDLRFLALGERHGWTDLHERFKVAFFADDFDEHGSVVKDSVRPVARREINEYIRSKDVGDDGTKEEHQEAVRNLGRLYSASVHERSPGIIRGSYEGPKRRWWAGGPRHEDSMAWERCALHVTTFNVLDVVARLVGPRWWGPQQLVDTSGVLSRLRQAIRLHWLPRLGDLEPPR